MAETAPGRPVTADLRGIEDDGRRWWAVAGRGYGVPWFYPARSGREAVAAHRRDSIAADVSMRYSQRAAAEFARSLGLTYSGPHTTRQAFVIDADGIWPRRNATPTAACRSYRTGPSPISTSASRCSPTSRSNRSWTP